MALSIGVNYKVYLQAEEEVNFFRTFLLGGQG